MSLTHRKWIVAIQLVLSLPLAARAQAPGMSMTLLNIQSMGGDTSGTSETKVVLDAPRSIVPATGSSARGGAPHVIVDLGVQRAYLVAGNTIQRMYVISSGRPGFETPKGSYVITAIRRNAWWYPPSSPWARGLKPIPPGPDNPMGPVKMQLGGSDIYLHGIPRRAEAKLGSPASHGCIRLSSSDALDLAARVRVGTRVKILVTRVNVDVRAPLQPVTTASSSRLD